MECWIFTFGIGQGVLAYRYVVIPGSWESARSQMILAFGTRWSSQYPDTPEIRAEQESYGCKELDLS